MRLTRSKPFDSPDYLFELKHDGFRAIVYIDNGSADLVSRNAHQLAFGSLKIALAQLPVKNAILDGEVVCIDSKGVSQFNQLLARKTPPIFYAFDLLWLNGRDLRKLPLVERKKRLEQLVKRSRCDELMYALHIEADGKRFFEEVCALDLEGIIAKRKNGIYREGRTDWLKIKNPKYTQAEGRHELLRRKMS
jgi:bifunctional non-homologous end joining protein LigD